MASNAEAEETMLYMQGYCSDYMVWNLSWAKPNTKTTSKNQKKPRQHQEHQRQTNKENEEERSIKAETGQRGESRNFKGKLNQKKKFVGGTRERRDSLASSNANTVPTIASSLDDE